MGEGKLARRIGFYALLLLVIWGSKELSIWLRGFNWAEKQILGGFKVPFYSLPMSYSVATGILVAICGGYLLFRILNKEKPATLLIDTETELKKVAWPSWPEAKQATVIVLLFVAFVAAYLTAVEFALKNVFDLILSIGS